MCVCVYAHTHAQDNTYYLEYPGISKHKSATHVSNGDAPEMQERSTTKAAKIPAPEPANRQERLLGCECSEMLWEAAICARDSTVDTLLLKIHQWSPPSPSAGFGYIPTRFFKL